ncbi:hypothetical protein CsSME_00014917 [Camellia sinensis var. sinensis]
MEVSVARGVFVSEPSEEPWKGKLITFSENPKLHMVEKTIGYRKFECVRRMELRMNANFQAVLDLILQVAVNGNLCEEEMIKTVFVFNDTEFDHTLFQVRQNVEYTHN